MKHVLICRLAVLCVGVGLCAGCASVTNVFVRTDPDFDAVPEASLREAARTIEAAVVQGERTPPLENRERVVVDTPRIRQAVKTRATRNALTADLLATEHAYEQRTGLIAILRSRAYKDATTRQERDRNALVVMSENNDRWAIYEGLLEANDWPAKALPAVQAIFFEERVELLPAGTHYEGPGGDVVAKTP